jgi:hypothetical protein
MLCWLPCVRDVGRPARLGAAQLRDLIGGRVFLAAGDGERGTSIVPPGPARRPQTRRAHPPLLRQPRPLGRPGRLGGREAWEVQGYGGTAAAQQKYPGERRERTVRMVPEIRERDGKGRGE